MSKLGRSVGKKATKATVKHSARGFSAKAKRQPMRSVSLLSVGGVVGATVGWLAGRKTARAA
jgi:F0F1-type ATP synthase assembly protein I